MIYLLLPGIITAAEISYRKDQEFLQETFFLGELSLDGSHPALLKGALPSPMTHIIAEKKRIIVPRQMLLEAALISA